MSPGHDLRPDVQAIEAPCISCGDPVPAAEWYTMAPVIMCRTCGAGLKPKDFAPAADELRRAALDRRGQP